MKDAGDVGRQAGVQGQPLGMGRNKVLSECRCWHTPFPQEGTCGTGISVWQGRCFGMRGAMALPEALRKTLWGSL